MPYWTLHVVLGWYLVLILLLLLHTRRTDRVVDRLVSFDALSILFVGVLSALAVQRQEPFYLDIALVVALLGFVQTVMAARLLEGRRNLQ